MADGTPIHPLLGGREAELVRGVEVDDVGVVGEDGRIVLVVEKRWHFERGVGMSSLEANTSER